MQKVFSVDADPAAGNVTSKQPALVTVAAAVPEQVLLRCATAVSVKPVSAYKCSIQQVEMYCPHMFLSACIWQMLAGREQRVTVTAQGVWAVERARGSAEMVW